MSGQFDQAQEFLARVLPWPQDGDTPAWSNLHWTFIPKDLQAGRKAPWTGRAVKTLGDAIKTLEFALKSKDTRDIYVGMATQREAVEARNAKDTFTYYKPVRLAENAVALKALFLDVDAYKDGPTGYPTMNEAVAALSKFLADTGLPRPTVIVHSGGGLHLHWCLSRALTPQEWYPLAVALIEATKRHGFKCDTSVTTDAARVLRIPQTWNCKQEPKRPVRIAGKILDFDYAYERIEKSLAPYKVVGAIMPHLNNPMAAALTPRQALHVEDELSAGIETAMPRDEVHECLEAIPNNLESWPRWNTIGMRVFAATEGAAYGLEEWQAWSDKLSTKGSDGCEARWETFQTSPPSRTGAGALVNQAKLATGDNKWTPRGSILARSVRSPLQSNGGFGLSAPLPGGLAVPGLSLTPGVTGTPAIPSANNADLPANYSRDGYGVVSLMGLDENGATTRTPVSDYPMLNPWLQKDPCILHFTTTTERGRQKTVSIENELINTNEMRRALQAQGFMLKVKSSAMGDFLVSWIKRLQESKDTVSSSPFGWTVRNGGVEGFVYGGRLWSPTGDKPAANPDAVIFRQYAPTGAVEPWQAAANLILDQGRPDIAAILASAFAAPLIRFTGEPGVLMSAHSIDSGIGKSTAMKVAQAVWGDPVKAVQSLSDTQNSVMNKIGEIRSLPLYWDELKTEDDTERFVKITFQVTQGKEKSRLTSQAKQRDLGTWQTLLVSASNESLLDHVVSKTSTTTAGLYRIFEFTVRPPTPGTQIATSDAARIVSKLNDNFGHAGLEYAKFLGVNHVRVEAEVAAYNKALGYEVGTANDERFWMALIATICMGARYANEIGLATFDEISLKKFMLATLAEMRRERAEQPVDMRQAMNVSNILAQFLNASRTRHTIFTNRIHITAGKPVKNSISIVHDTARLDGIHVHVGVEDKLLRMSSAALSEWLSSKNYSRHAFVKALEEEFGMKKVSGRMASGTALAGATEYLLQIDLAGSPLANFIDEV